MLDCQFQGVGGNAQIPCNEEGCRSTADLTWPQHRELAAFAQFGSELDKANTGSVVPEVERLIEILKQPQYTPAPVEEQVIMIFAAINGHLDDTPTEKGQRV